jgi:hypothetical protein
MERKLGAFVDRAIYFTLRHLACIMTPYGINETQRDKDKAKSFEPPRDADYEIGFEVCAS